MNIKKENIFQFIRFVFVGGIATVIHYLIYYGLLNLDIVLNLSYTIGYVISFIFNYIATNYFTFKTNPSVKNGIKFAMCHVVNYLLQILLLNLFIKLGVNRNIAPIFVFMIAVPVNFILVRIAVKKK